LKSKWGKRRVFIIGGVVAGTIGLLVFGNSKTIGDALSSDESTSRTIAIVVSITSLWALNIGLNVVQSPAWALTLDICNNDAEVTKSTAAVTALSATGTLAANLLGFANLVALLTFFNSNTQAMFYIGTACLFLSCFPTLLLGKEKSGVAVVNDNGKDHERASGGGVRAFIASLRATPRPIVKLCVAYFASSAAMSPFYFYWTDFVGADVFGGVADAARGSAARQRYDDGVRFGSLGLALMAGVTLINSLCLPLVQRQLSKKQVYFAAHIVALVGVILPLFAFGKAASMVAVGAIGVLNSTYSTIPFGMLSTFTTHDSNESTSDAADNNDNDNGFYIGLLNIAQVTGQMIANLLCGLIMSATDRVYSCFAVGLFFVALGMIAILFLDKTR
jgi:Na+/melibiose symporter-like transporter